MRFTRALAALVLVCGASSAFADLVKAQNVTFSTTAGTFSSGPVNALNGQLVDNLLVLNASLTAGAPGTIDVTVIFPVNGPRGEAPIRIATTSATTAGVTVARIAYYNQAGTFANRLEFTTFAGGNALPSATDTMFRPTGGGTSFGSGFTLGTYDAVVITLNVASVGNAVSIDMIANPEPGTIALFGLGMAGMFAFAWRRRNAAKLATVKSIS